MHTDFHAGPGEWWKNLKVGDKVFISTDMVFGVTEVTRITAKHISLFNSESISLASGHRVGGTAYDSTLYYPCTPENVAVYNLYFARRVLSNQKWDELPAELVMDIYRKVKAARAKRKEATE